MRVRAVVGNSIMVRIEDVVPGDILHVGGTERDPIISEIERDASGNRRLIYDRRPNNPVHESTWMAETDCCFVHDLHHERDFFEKETA